MSNNVMESEAHNQRDNRKIMIERFLVAKSQLLVASRQIEDEKEQQDNLVKEKKALSEILRQITYERDNALETTIIENNEAQFLGKISELKQYNETIEKKLLEEQKKFNNSKLLLDEVKEKLDVTERTLNSCNKKIEAVHRELEKHRKAKQPTIPAKTNTLAKLFSSPPPVIASQTILKKPPPTTEAQRSSIFSFFKRGK